MKMIPVILSLSVFSLGAQALAGGSTGGYTGCSTPDIRCPSGRVIGCNATPPNPNAPTDTYNTCSWGSDWVACTTTYRGAPYSEVSDSCQ